MDIDNKNNKKCSPINNKKTSSEDKIKYDDALVNYVCYCNNYFYNATKIVVLLPCNHLMHEKCISYYLINNKKKCPLCDVEYIKASENLHLKAKKHILNKEAYDITFKQVTEENITNEDDQFKLFNENKQKIIIICIII